VARDNGLPAASAYAALADVDPPVADHVLALLGQAGIPAYAEPTAGTRGPYAEIRPHQRPMERIYVDRTQMTPARAAINQALPALEAQFHSSATAEQHQSDEQPGAHADDLTQRRINEQWAAISTRLAREGLGSDIEPRRPDPEPDDVLDEIPESERFVAPVPPPLPEGDRLTRLAWAALIGGPLLVIFSAILGLGPAWLATLGLAGFIAGFITLVVRMPDSRNRDGDGWDDGAVV
jgi:hypothetical protein